MREPAYPPTSVLIESGIDGMQLAVYRQPASPVGDSSPNPVVLYVHGATFPACLSIFYRFDGYSWADQLNENGYRVYGFDQLGFGESTHYPQMSRDANTSAPLGRAEEVMRQIERVADYINEQTGDAKIDLLAHSWGTIPAALFTQMYPHRVERLALFAPIARREPVTEPHTADVHVEAVKPGWHRVTAADQQSRFEGYVPPNETPVLNREHFLRWAESYLASDKESATLSPATVKVPYGPVADFGDALNGRLAYDPAQISVPALIVRGEWDPNPDDADAKWLFDSLTQAPIKYDVKISRGTHVMHLEESRFALYSAVVGFFEGK